MNSWILPAFLTLICWGVWGFIPKITTQYITPMSAMVYEAIGVGIMGCVVLVLLGFHPDTNPKGVGLAILTGILGISGALGYLFAVKFYHRFLLSPNCLRRPGGSFEKSPPGPPQNLYLNS